MCPLDLEVKINLHAGNRLPLGNYMHVVSFAAQRQFCFTTRRRDACTLPRRHVADPQGRVCRAHATRTLWGCHTEARSRMCSVQRQCRIGWWAVTYMTRRRRCESNPVQFQTEAAPRSRVQAAACTRLLGQLPHSRCAAATPRPSGLGFARRRAPRTGHREAGCGLHPSSLPRCGSARRRKTTINQMSTDLGVEPAAAT
jgi:hypothetical protein